MRHGIRDETNAIIERTDVWKSLRKRILLDRRTVLHEVKMTSSIVLFDLESLEYSLKEIEA